jgi:hypothetical protein
MAGDNTKNAPGFLDLLSSFKLSSIFKKKEPEEEISYPLADAKQDWAEALELFRAGHYDQATPVFRRSVENLLKANCPGSWSKKVASSNLLVLANKVLGEPPAHITEALAFLNPHCTKVRSVYNYDFACDVKEKSRLVIGWIAERRPSYSTFDPDKLPVRKSR